jgi:hypothetical protein
MRIGSKTQSDGEGSYSLKEAQIVIEKWRLNYSTKWPHSAPDKDMGSTFGGLALEPVYDT